MIRFFDASALVQRYVEEPGTSVVLELLAGGTPTASRISEVEVASALARRCREGAFGAAQRDRAFAQLHEDFGSLYVVELTASVVARAFSLLERHPLRTADAVQLASGLELADRMRLPVELVAFDDRLVGAARREGLIPAL